MALRGLIHRACSAGRARVLAQGDGVARVGAAADGARARGERRDRAARAHVPAGHVRVRSRSPLPPSPSRPSPSGRGGARCGGLEWPEAPSLFEPPRHPNFLRPACSQARFAGAGCRGRQRSGAGGGEGGQGEGHEGDETAAATRIQAAHRGNTARLHTHSVALVRPGAASRVGQPFQPRWRKGGAPPPPSPCSRRLLRSLTPPSLQVSAGGRGDAPTVEWEALALRRRSQVRTTRPPPPPAP